MRRLALLCVLALAGCGRGCGCGEKPKARTPEAPPIAVTPGGDREDLSERALTFKPPLANGQRRFAAPRGGEILALAAAPDGTGLVGVTNDTVYLFDADAERARAVRLPGLHPVPHVVALPGGRAVVFVKAPVEGPAGRFYVVDGQKGEIPVRGDLPGVPALGAALAGDRVALALADPPRVVVLDLSGKLLAESALPSAPVRLEVAPGGGWAALALAAGAVTIDVSGAQPTVAPLAVGQGRLAPIVALPIGEAVLVVGVAEGTRPFALVSPRAPAPGAEVRPLAIGVGEVAGGARSEDGTRALVFTVEPSDGGAARHAWVFDTATWKTVGHVAVAPSLAGARPVALGGRVLFPTCRDAVAIDLATLSGDVAQRFPAAETAPCLDGLYRVGEKLAARDRHQIVTWTP